MCSAADDPTTYAYTYRTDVWTTNRAGEDDDPTTYEDLVVREYSGATIYSNVVDWTEVNRLDDAIARRNIAWAAWQDEADELYNAVTDGEHAPFGPYNEAQKAYEHAVSDLMREQARWRHNRHA